ncbi:MAG: CHAT domain-containing protein [Bacteroidales bacterium]|nr:CHAT domain-containing protein [Bacteroidales bacterium]
MSPQLNRSGLLTVFLLLFGGLILVSKESDCREINSRIVFESQAEINFFDQSDNDIKLKELNSQLLALVTLMNNNIKEADSEKILDIISRLNQILDNTKTPSLEGSDSYYIIGIFYLLTGNPTSSITNLKKSMEVRESLKVFDLRFTRACYNIGIAHRQLGDFYKTAESQLKAIEIISNLFGETSIELLYPLASLSSAYIETQQNEKSISCLNSALSIAESKPDSVPGQTLGNLYSNLGVSYNRLADFSKARLYFEKSLSIYHKNEITSDENYLNLINNLAITYEALRNFDRSEEYYRQGVAIALNVKENSAFHINIVNSYAVILGNKGDSKKGEELLYFILNKSAADSAKNPQVYYEALYNYGEYLREYKIDVIKSLTCLKKCMKYLEKHPDDILLRPRINIGYSLSLAVNGERVKAIETIQNFISIHYNFKFTKGSFHNPELTSLKPEKTTFRLFRSKYTILKSLYKETRNYNYLEASAETAEIIVALLEKMRINISEEDSRLILGDKYRNAYFSAIGDYHELYRISGDAKFLSKAFEYSEKSKVAGLLASTRELKATQFQIPEEIAEYEFKLKNEIGLLNARIDIESLKEKPNQNLINTINENLLNVTRSRDSLILMFENAYPEYYSMKYNTMVASMDDINQIIGRKGNYINYLLSDSLLFIFIANRKYKELIATPVNDSLFNNVKKFRKLLAMPGPADDAYSAFKEFKITGTELYKALLEPILPFLVSDKLIISPDNILSYIPFETLPTCEFPDNKPLYREVPFMMAKYDISYTYSATFMSESVTGGPGFRNTLLAFAPDYPEAIDIQSVLLSRQGESSSLKDLPFAREEARFVTEITGGKLYENSDAKESSFKKESGNYDILHLAMHTVLNDKDPMHSTLIFSPEADTLEDRYLKTYEIYGIPLKAKMVVLSSCNTGSGILFTGEGILSLARGFTYSGSHSVVMSMWEIEDKSGTEIVKMFYKNIKKGYTKSASLRMARLEYLKNSDQLRSHPYFWSALIVYGNNDPLYFPVSIIRPAIAFLCVILLTALFYLRRRKYS